jgi:CoA:oxalate CoA-transferase
MSNTGLPLEGVLIVDLSQFLSAPSAALRLADLGARVIKVERPGTGDICRTLYVSDTRINGESTIFQAINRNKESFEADLKDDLGKRQVLELIKQADVLIHNFRPGVIERLGFSFEELKLINPSIIYGAITGYGTEGDWKDLPGQDLLLQSVSGITYLNKSDNDVPVPMGVAVADILAGTHLAQGLLAALYGRFFSGEGALIEISMLESLLDFQFEELTHYYNDEQVSHHGINVNNGHPCKESISQICATQNGYIAVASDNVEALAALVDCPQLLCVGNIPGRRETECEFGSKLSKLLLSETTGYWLSSLERLGIQCTEVFNYDQLTAHEGYRILQMEQEVSIHDSTLVTTRCPIRLDGDLLRSSKGAPDLGEDTDKIIREFNLPVA